jgi:dTDP-4-dehydrorhamnose reductase
MLGSSIVRFLSGSPGFSVTGTIRANMIPSSLPSDIQRHLVCGVSVDESENLIKIFKRFHPDIVINCIGMVKQGLSSDSASAAIYVNSLFPHRLMSICELINARLIQISTDCVFSGLRGMYSELDKPDAIDIYGLSKLLGEVVNSDALTIRTSIIGHELAGNHSLISWFLSQNEKIDGYTGAIFSGFPTVELSRIIRDFIIPNKDLKGLYHLSSSPISKFDLLSLVKEVYQKNIQINDSSALRINRSLDSEKFRKETGFSPKPWSEMIEDMYKFR